jgi:hypothetical protein
VANFETATLGARPSKPVRAIRRGRNDCTDENGTISASGKNLRKI